MVLCFPPFFTELWFSIYRGNWWILVTMR
jgi:hypothetical protein